KQTLLAQPVGSSLSGKPHRKNVPEISSFLDSRVEMNQGWRYRSFSPYLFERQAKRIGVEKTNWVSALLARMPPDITQLIARESEDKFDNYDYIKGVLLKRFKMSPETFRQKFMKHQRIPARSWRDFLCSKLRVTSKNGSMEWKVKGINCPSNKNLNSQHLNLLAIRVEELGIPRGCVMLKIIRKPPPTRQINAVETNERFQEQSSAILTAKVAIPVYSPAKENEKIDELQFVPLSVGMKF
ncbi:uncharacterized protein TNCV_1974991, partial [Trichonephila clavipes]